MQLGMPIVGWLVLIAAAAILVEVQILRRRGERFDGPDAAESVLVGATWAGLRLVAGKALMFFVWLWVWDEIAPIRLPMDDPRTWLAYWLIGDFLYYWTHRIEHRVRVLWASHLVHHSSTRFNLATAVRQPPTEVFYKPVIALWAPLCGFHPTMYVVFGTISLAVGQWQHLEWFPKVRSLDAIFMTPSNHRVHHGTNPRYIDRNFGGSLVVWDRMFGTYEPEGEAVAYGLVHDPRRGSVFGRMLGGYPELVESLRARRSSDVPAGRGTGDTERSYEVRSA